MDSAQKSGYYAAILSGKEDHGLWSLSTAKHLQAHCVDEACGKFIRSGEH